MISGEWDVARIAADAYDLEGKVVGTVGAGRIGQRVLQRLKVSQEAGYGSSALARIQSEHQVGHCHAREQFD